MWPGSSGPGRSRTWDRENDVGVGAFEVIGPGFGATIRAISAGRAPCPAGPRSALLVERAEDRLAGVLGLEHDEVAGALEHLAHQPRGPGVGSSIVTAPSASSSITVRSSRIQRERSGETHTRATFASATSPSVSQLSNPGISSTWGLASNERDVSRLLYAVEPEVADVVLPESQHPTYHPSGPFASR